MCPDAAGSRLLGLRLYRKQPEFHERGGIQTPCHGKAERGGQIIPCGYARSLQNSLVSAAYFEAMLVLFAFILSALYIASGNCQQILSALPLDKDFFKDVACHATVQADGCWPQSCSRQVIDGYFSDEDIASLKVIVNKGLSQSALEPGGGPSIFDLNTGFVRTPKGVENIFSAKHDNVFTAQDFAVYRDIITRLKELVKSRMGIATLYFTAPTFVTRLDATDPTWEPAGMHDEYWHLHVDGNSTSHYTYSGLLYLSTYERDFDGGRLLFYNKDEETVEQILEPRSGRVVMFTSGPENPHHVERLLGGQRFTLSFWFTCIKEREFEIFLDGEAHMSFGKRYVESLQRRQQQQQQQKRGEL